MHTSFSIVVPFLDDESAFETSLVSVLQNRPSCAEVVVVHDGSYDDPFDLGDEVRFVVAEEVRADRSRLIGLITEAVQRITADVVHVIGGGLQVSENWHEPALDHFVSERCGAVAPVIRRGDEAGSIEQAGLSTSWSQACFANARGQQRLDKGHFGAVHAPALVASFWRTELLICILQSCCDGQLSGSEAELFAGYALAEAGFDCRVAPQSTVVASEAFPVAGGFAAGRASQTIRNAACRASTGAATLDALIGLCSAAFRPSSWGAACGRLSAASAGLQQQQLRRLLDSTIEEIRDLQDDPEILTMPTEVFTTRRAA